MPDEYQYSLLRQQVSETEATSNKNELKIPEYLVYESGEFAHQGQAVSAWEDKEHRGILEMATGAGKTITAMVCATSPSGISKR